MGLKCYIVCVVMLSALITQSVHGFGLSDVIRELESRDAKPATREIKTPADVIVSVALEMVDTNSDGKVALSEVRDYLARYFEKKKKGYLAMQADHNGDGNLDESETRQWIDQAKTTYTFRRLMAYAKIASLGGIDMADRCMMS